jgi:NADPH-dependent 7-cyano-7-deazaguanine reductase QueF
MPEQTLEELYGISKRDVQLNRVKTKSGKYLEWFKNPQKDVIVAKDEQAGQFMVVDEGWSALRIEIEFPEFTCLCPRTSQPDFATITLRYIPNERCAEL